MAKTDKEMMARLEGMAFAYKIAQEKGLDELAEEIRFRKKTGISINVSRQDLNKAAEQIKEQTCDTFMVMTIAALHDAFGFGEKRIQKFMDKFNQGADYLVQDLATWDDYIAAIKEEVGIDIKVRWNK